MARSAASGPGVVAPIRSTVSWSLLGLIISRPSYGYELSRRYERLYGAVLPMSSPSQVYTALDRLEATGLVEAIPGSSLDRRPKPSLDRQPKPWYRATALGFKSYEDWLVNQVVHEGRDQELWVRQLDVFADDPQAALRILDRFEAEYLRRAGDQHTTGRSELVELLVAEQRRIVAGAMVSWVRVARARFRALAAVADQR
jgi:DNA-binding PadR family transcriptional regulator